MIVILQNVWFKILLFLVVAPIIVVAFAFWLIVLKFYTDMKSSSKPGLHYPLHSSLRTMYTPEPHTWDQPLPIWAIGPPQPVWDPVYLQQLDPRYVSGPTRSPWESRSSRSRVSDEGKARLFNPREYLYSRSETISLSDKYNPEKQQAESVSLSERYGGPKQQLSFAKGNKTSPENRNSGQNMNNNYHTSNLEIEIFDNTAGNDKKEYDSDDNIQTFTHEALVSNKILLNEASYSQIVFQVSFEDDNQHRANRTDRHRTRFVQSDTHHILYHSIL